MIRLSAPVLYGDESKYVMNAVASLDYGGDGYYCRRLEELIRAETGARNVVLVSSGTAGIHLSLIALGVVAGDKVATSAITFVGGAFPIMQASAEPVFLGVDETSHIDIDDLKASIIKHRPKAVIVPHLYGAAAKIDEIADICRENDVFIIEDAAEALGVKYDDVPVGMFGDVGVFSFNANKIVTAGGGGAVVTDDDDIADAIRYLSNQAYDGLPFYYSSNVGYNYRIGNIQCAVGCAQVENLRRAIERRRSIYEKYSDLIGESGIELDIYDSVESNRWLPVFSFKRKPVARIMSELAKAGAETRLTWTPLPLMRMFAKYDLVSNGTSIDAFWKRYLCLPAGGGVDENVIEMICYTAKK